MRVKICGVTNTADAVCAEASGADAIGVVVCSNSPRNVPLGEAREIFSALGPFVTRVLVTHTTSLRDIEEIRSIRPDAIQVFQPFPREVAGDIRMIRVVQPGTEMRGDCDAVIIDSSHGRGQVYDPGFAREVIRRSPLPVILAGGLTPENVTEAIRALHPYGVDVATGVEKSPGKKDPERVRAFIRACRYENDEKR
ncbi:MAG: phosphoribosylanthranilate isomerase [Methanoregulaceae archaeon]|nr:phosphoribosylanthranilate isomerase [Methanoregulaceae archaeon]